MSYRDEVNKLLQEYKASKLTEDEVLEKIRRAGFEEMDFVKLDHDRSARQGFPEVVFCAGKTNEQSLKIIKRLAEEYPNVLATRGNKELAEEVCRIIPQAVYNADARLISIEKKPLPKDEERYIAVVTAGTSDIPVAEEAALTAEIMGNRVERVYDVGVAGIHRLFAKLDVLRGANCLVVIAGMEGALGSVVGGLVDKPIIAVPTSVGYGANFQGISALLGMLNSCAAGIAVVNIDNGFGAGRMASMINHLR